MLSEYIKVELPELKRFNAEIEELNDRLRKVQEDRQAVIDAAAQPIASYSVGDKFQSGKQTHVITAVKGEYVNYLGLNMPPCVFVQYDGYREFKNGTVGRTGRVYPAQPKEHLP